MRILSVRKGFETDHSTSSYGYIDGIKLDYVYGKWVSEFRMIYNTELFNKLRELNYECIMIKKKFNRIIVALTLYSEIIGEDVYEWAALINEIKKEVEKHNIEPLEVVEAYCTDKEKYEGMKTKTDIGRKLQNCLTLI